MRRTHSTTSLCFFLYLTVPLSLAYPLWCIGVLFFFFLDFLFFFFLLLFRLVFFLFELYVYMGEYVHTYLHICIFTYACTQRITCRSHEISELFPKKMLSMQPEEEGFVGFRREGGEGVGGEKESSMRIIWNSSRNVRIIHINWISDGPNYECACTCMCQCICMGVRESCVCVCA